MEGIEIVKSSNFKHPGPAVYTGFYYYVSDYVKKIIKNRLSKEEYQRVTVVGIREGVSKLHMDYIRDHNTTAILVRDTIENFEKVKEYIGYLEKHDITMMTAFAANAKLDVFIQKSKEIIDSIFTPQNLQAILDSVVIKESKPTLDIKHFVPIGLWIHNGVEIDGEVKLLPFNLSSNLVKFSVNYISDKLLELYPYPYEWKLVHGKLASAYIKIWHYEYKSVTPKFKRSPK
jgi:hypothetical protein